MPKPLSAASARALRKSSKRRESNCKESLSSATNVIDLRTMCAIGLAIAVKNASAGVKQQAYYITPNAGGDGAPCDSRRILQGARQMEKGSGGLHRREKQEKQPLAAVHSIANNESRPSVGCFWVLGFEL
jgi:hypothetical protein